jgi:DNA-binding IclR family transcriptional regulator
MKEIKDKDFQVPAASRVLDIIEFLSFSTKSATIKEISDSLGIPLVSVSRVVNLLNSRGYLKQQPGQLVLIAWV